MQAFRIWWHRAIIRRPAPVAVWERRNEMDNIWDNKCCEHDVDNDIEQNGKTEEGVDDGKDEGGNYLFT